MPEAPEPEVPDTAVPAGDDDVPPMLPSRTAFLLSFGAVVLAGIFGAIIGYGVTDIGSTSNVATFFGTLVGSIIGAGGVGIVAVLVLRAMAEWNRQNKV